MCKTSAKWMQRNEIFLKKYIPKNSSLWGKEVKRNGDTDCYCEDIWKSQVSRRDTVQNAHFLSKITAEVATSWDLFTYLGEACRHSCQPQAVRTPEDTAPPPAQCLSVQAMDSFISNSEKWHHLPTHHLKGHKEQTGRQAIFHSRFLHSLFALYISSLPFTE